MAEFNPAFLGRDGMLDSLEEIARNKLEASRFAGNLVMRQDTGVPIQLPRTLYPDSSRALGDGRTVETVTPSEELL
jgi:hypothetical protein